MKLDSKLFDRIRIKSRHEEKPPHVEAPHCSWEGCAELGLYRAPKGHRSEGEFHNFCLEHVRHYNTAFNFFSGMDPDQLEEALHKPQAAAARPAFGLNNKTGAPKMRRMRARDPNQRFGDPLNIFARYNWAQSKEPKRERVQPLHELDRRALETLGFHAMTKPEEIKKAYKSLVKIHHPDANGGDRASEDRLRAIIAAYTHLKTKGFVGR
jgi:DnaJ-domain-containing protein 1